MSDEEKGAELIAAERQRQITAEGWTAEHDAEHHPHALVDAAICYARAERDRRLNRSVVTPPRDWPWDDAYWKPCPEDRVRELVKAGALIAAAIDRLKEEA